MNNLIKDKYAKIIAERLYEYHIATAYGGTSVQLDIITGVENMMRNCPAFSNCVYGCVEDMIKDLSVKGPNESNETDGAFGGYKFVQMLTHKGEVFVATERNLWVRDELDSVFKPVNFVVNNESDK